MTTILNRPDAGITVIELLIVVAIGVLMAALAIPAISGSRESARIAHCANKDRPKNNFG